LCETGYRLFWVDDGMLGSSLQTLPKTSLSYILSSYGCVLYVVWLQGAWYLFWLLLIVKPFCYQLGWLQLAFRLFFVTFKARERMSFDILSKEIGQIAILWHDQQFYIFLSWIALMTLVVYGEARIRHVILGLRTHMCLQDPLLSP